MTAFVYSNGSSSAETEVIIKFDGKHRFLSNMSACSIILPAEEIDGEDGHLLRLPEMKFSSVENAYMAWKTTDLSVRKKIQTLAPDVAKELTKRADFPLRQNYSDLGRIVTVFRLTEQKYDASSNPALREKLLATGTSVLIEGTTWGDRFFGKDLADFEGHNWLGKIIMVVRDNEREKEGLPRARDLPDNPLLPDSVRRSLSKIKDQSPDQVG